MTNDFDTLCELTLAEIDVAKIKNPKLNRILKELEVKNGIWKKLFNPKHTDEREHTDGSYDHFDNNFDLGSHEDRQSSHRDSYEHTDYDYSEHSDNHADHTDHNENAHVDLSYSEGKWHTDSNNVGHKDHNESNHTDSKQ